MTPNDDSRIEAFVGEMVNLYAQEFLTEYPALAANVQLGVARHVTENLIMTLRSWCWSGKIPSNESSHTVRWPDGVWQTFKERHMPKWFKHRWPVRWHEETFRSVTNHYFVCPHLVTDAQNSHIKFMATGSDLARRIPV